MIQTGFLLLALSSGAAAAARGFDETPAFVAKPSDKKFSRPWFDALGGEEYGFGAIRGLLEANRELEMSMSMSMSISMSYDYNPKPTSPKTPSPTPSGFPAVPSSSPSAIVTSSAPSASTMPTTTPGPTITLQPTVSPVPSASPSTSSVPSSSLLPTISPPSVAPTGVAPVSVSTGVPAPTPVDTDGVVGIYECTNQGVALSDDIANVTTLINLSVAYAAEINGTELSPDAIADLEAALLQAAIGAALDCGSSSNRLLQQQDRELLATTDTLGPCNATIDGASCFVLETDLAFVLNKEVNPQYVAYLAYLSMKDGMANGTFSEDIEQIHKLTYLAPLPLVAPPNTTQPLDVNDESETPPEDSRRTNNWTIGACIAMSTGGLLALGAWFYKRRYQNKRHIELDDDRSDSPVSLFSAERDMEQA